MTALSVVQDAWLRLGIDDDLPGAVWSSVDLTPRVMRSLLTQEGRELAARGAWQRLVKEQSITTTATQAQAGALPSDYSRVIPETVWNYTDREPLIGPIDAREWQALSASVVGPPDLHFRVRGNDFLILPTPEAGQNIRFEYVSAWWVDTDGDGDGDADAPASDTDTFLLPEELLTLGVMWRWLKRNRMPYDDYLAEYTTQVTQALGRDGVKGVLSMGGTTYGPRRPGVPDGSWNL